MSSRIKSISFLQWVDSSAEFLCNFTGANNIVSLCNANKLVAQAQGYALGVTVLFLLLLLGASLYLIVIDHVLSGFASACMIIGAIMFCSVLSSRMVEVELSNPNKNKNININNGDNSD